MLFEGSKIHSETTPGDLHKAAGETGAGSKNLESLVHPLPADEAHLDRIPVGHGSYDRSHTGSQEVYIAGNLSRLIEHGPERQRNRFEVGEEGCSNSGRKSINK